MSTNDHLQKVNVIDLVVDYVAAGHNEMPFEDELRVFLIDFCDYLAVMTIGAASETIQAVSAALNDQTDGYDRCDRCGEAYAVEDLTTTDYNDHLCELCLSEDDFEDDDPDDDDPIDNPGADMFAEYQKRKAAHAEQHDRLYGGDGESDDESPEYRRWRIARYGRENESDDDD